MTQSCITKAHLSMEDSSQKLGPWNTQHSLQAAGYAFQVTQI